MDKLRMMTNEISQENIAKIRELFPSAVKEVKDLTTGGGYHLAVDFDVLKQELSGCLIDDGQERYQFTWPDKRKSVVLANSAISATLRPVKEDETSPSGEDASGKPYISSGSVDFDTTQNLYIEGDNLKVLKLLRETYLGKVKMIYIDPPYNTGNDFVYEDDFTIKSDEWSEKSGDYDEEGNRLVKNLESNGRFHTDWLNMIYPRLRLARDLLTDDGVIFISIDDNEQANLKKICDEIFGESNFVTIIAWQCLDTIKNDAKYFSDNHEYILVYARILEKLAIQGIEKGDKQRAYYKNYDNDPRGDYLLTPLHAKSGTASGIYSYTFSNGQTWTPPQGTYPRFSKETLQKLDEDNRLYLDPLCIKTPQKKTYLSEVGNRMPPVSFWDYETFGSTRQSNKELSDLIGKGIFQNSKPSKTIKILLDLIANNKDSIILDFFSGSATTAHAVMQLNAEDGGNRKFIMVQLPEKCDEKSEAYKAGYKNICEIGKERIRRAGTKIVEERAHLLSAVKSGAFEKGKPFAQFTNSESAKAAQAEIRKTLDIGFRVLKLDSSNMQDVYYNPAAVSQTLLDATIDNIKPDRSPLDLLFQVMLELGVPLSAKIEEHTINGKTYFAVNGNDVIACFDDNIDNDVITAIAKQQPLYAVFKDKSFASDSVAINNEQLFKTYSPTTIIKVV